MSDQSQQQGQVPTEPLNALVIAPSAPQTFPLFNELPPELRVKIWCLTFPRGTGPTGRRRIDLNALIYDKSSDDDSEDESDGDDTSDHTMDSVQFWNRPKAPITLSICRESRQEALRHYRLLFDFSGRPNMPHSRPIYYNPKLDIIHLPYKSLYELPAVLYSLNWLGSHAPVDMDSIQAVEIQDSVQYVGEAFPYLHDDNQDEDEFCLLRCFRRLRFLNIIDHIPFYWNRQYLVPWYKSDRANTNNVRAYIRRRQAEDPTWLMPSIRFAPSDERIQEVLEQWPEDRWRGRDGRDPFTDVGI
jgi:hypothetical protein